MVAVIPSVIPALDLPDPYAEYLRTLRASPFRGEIEDGFSARLLAATDNSVYQSLPHAVIFPTCTEDVQLALRLGHDCPAPGITFTARGGGTGTNGQSLNRGVIIDFSRHMKLVTHYEPEARRVTVQPGVIKDELNERLAGDGLFFSPELSTSNRATVGGMISNDAAGQGSLVYGRTSDHVVGLKAVLCDGTLCDFHAVSGGELEECCRRPGSEGELYRALHPLLQEHADHVREVFPRLNRFLTGYDLMHAYDPQRDELNVARLICGAEGTLAVAVEVTLSLTPLPRFRALLVIRYDGFVSALRHAPRLMKAGALSVETVDGTVLSLARRDVVWETAGEYIHEEEGQSIGGLSIVEFASADGGEEQERLLQALQQEVMQAAAEGRDGLLGAEIAATPAAIAAVYNMRKKAVGLLGSMATRQRLVPFVEDTAVPPEHLCDYIIEFRRLLDGLQVIYGMFGHVDTGVIHVRPALDLTQDEDKRKLLTISDAVAALVQKYGGQMWGEHGRGYRAGYAELFFRDLYPVVRRIKTIFDPGNRLNPRKICVPLHSEEEVVRVNSPMRGDFDRRIPLSVRQSFAGALSCNGNGQCFTYQSQALMCPSYRYTRDHVRSPKGYAELMRAWLLLLSEQGVDVRAAEAQADGAGAALSWHWRLFNTLFDRGDYSHEYRDMVRTCVSCKSCKTQCPSHVNAADLNSRFLSLYYGRYLRPASDLLTLQAERVLPLLSDHPRPFNALTSSPAGRTLLRRSLGYADLPRLAGVPFVELCRSAGIEELSEAQIPGHGYDTVIVLDSFTRAYDARGALALGRVLQFLGCHVCYLHPRPSGKLHVVRGDRRGFLVHARRQAARLSRLAAAGLKLVGYDPALTLCYRDEYPELLGEDGRSFRVLLPQELLAEQLRCSLAQEVLHMYRPALDQVLARPFYREDFYILCHCTEQALSTAPGAAWQGILEAFGLQARVVNLSCCGMAGLFGHLQANLDESLHTYRSAWQATLKRYHPARCLVTGFSCRSQVQRHENQRPDHPLDLIDRCLSEAGIISGLPA